MPGRERERGRPNPAPSPKQSKAKRFRPFTAWDFWVGAVNRVRL